MLFYSFLTAIFLAKFANAHEAFAAISEVESLLETQSKLIENLNEFISHSRQSLEQLETFLNHITLRHETALQGGANYLQNPINAFKLIHKFTNDWNEITNIIVSQADMYVSNVADINVTNPIPTSDDLSGAALGLARLQDTYQLPLDDLLRGSINGEKSENLTTTDCFEVGRQVLRTNDFGKALFWLLEAYWHRGNDQSIFPASQVDILENLSYTFYKLEKIHLAQEITEELLKIDPENEAAQENMKLYTMEMENSTSSMGDERIDDFKLHGKAMLSLHRDPVYEKYKSLCRGEASRNTQHQLTCRYARKRHPFTILAPFKEEQVSRDPPVLVFHDVISDNEIQSLISVVKGKLSRSRVNSGTGQVPSPIRVSKLSWLNEEAHECVPRINRRIGYMTNLNVNDDSAEELQVVNYGIGGHYGTHYDFRLAVDSPDYDEKSNRIATVLFYFTDVTQGGATVFPGLDLAIWPEKGSAAFWYNLFENGEGDLRTLHAACPVLTGTKWAANKWIQDHFQEFVRPCALERGPVEQDYANFINHLQ